MKNAWIVSKISRSHERTLPVRSSESEIALDERECALILVPELAA